MDRERLVIKSRMLIQGIWNRSDGYAIEIHVIKEEIS